MKHSICLLVGLIILSNGALVRADLKVMDSTYAVASHDERSSLEVADLIDDSTCASSGFSFLETSDAKAPSPEFAIESGAVLRMPEAPNSAALFLSAMVSLGAWQLVRSSRDFHFSAMPEWYHTGGPIQIGHITPFNLDFTTVALSVFDRPAQLRKVTLCWQRELSYRWGPQAHLTVEDSRGPPPVAN